MDNFKRLSKGALIGILGVGCMLAIATEAVSQTIIYRGRNNAPHIVTDSEQPQEQVVQSKPSRRTSRFPRLVQRGPHGAAHIANDVNDLSSQNIGGAELTKEYKGFPKLIYRGRGAAHLMLDD